MIISSNYDKLKNSFRYYPQLTMIENDPFNRERVIIYENVAGLSRETAFKQNKIFPDSMKNKLYLSHEKDKPIVFIHLQPSFAHFIIDTIMSVFGHILLNPNSLFIINVSHLLKIDKSTEPYRILFDILDKNNINYEILMLRPNEKILINNFYYNYKTVEFYFQFVQFTKYIQKYKNNDTPNKIVYLDRRKSVSEHNKDLRLDDEDVLIKYLESKNVTIVSPEDFKTIEEQIVFFSDVKILFSSTCAGLLNMLFMKENTTVCEFLIPIMAEFKTELHDHYRKYSVIQNQKYISIPGIQRADDFNVQDLGSSETIIQHIESLGIL